MASASNSTSNLSKRSEFHIGNKYRLVRKIGSGSFGDIYLGINISTGEVYHFLCQCCYFQSYILYISWSKYPFTVDSKTFQHIWICFVHIYYRTRVSDKECLIFLIMWLGFQSIYLFSSDVLLLLFL